MALPTPKTILVVDDDFDTRNTLRIMLTALKYTPVLCGSGAEALEKLKTTKVDVALVDVMMPQMNGYEVVKALKAMDKHAHVPCILVTAKDKDTEMMEGYTHGADYYITKPFTVKQIQYGIQLMLGEVKE